VKVVAVVFTIKKEPLKTVFVKPATVTYWPSTNPSADVVVYVACVPDAFSKTLAIGNGAEELDDVGIMYGATEPVT
jgi:hypothetical protein